MVSAGSGRPSLRINWRRALLWILASGAPIATSILLIPDIRGVFGSGLALLMVAIAAADARDYVIPDGLTLLALILGVVNAGIEPSYNVTQDVALAALRAAALALAFLTLRIGYRRLRGRQGLGLGDVKLAGVCGLWLDWSTIPIAVEIAALAALSVYLLRQFVLRRPVRATARLPFGVFFAPAIWLAWLLEVTLLIPL
jgi:leader peptidase (prepilin peptidase) / N-methyltransferase